MTPEQKSQSFLDKHPKGTYMAKPVDWGISKTQAGLPQVAITFRYEHGDLNWYGSFKDTVVERTVDTLILLGLKGTLETLADGIPSKALDPEKEVEIVVEHRPDQKGSMRAGIAWVNDPGRTSIKKIEKGEASSLLSGINAVLIQRRQAAGVQVSAPAPATQAPPQSTFSTDDVPF